jgi:hypothetical protein
MSYIRYKTKKRQNKAESVLRWRFFCDSGSLRRCKAFAIATAITAVCAFQRIPNGSAYFPVD